MTTQTQHRAKIITLFLGVVLVIAAAAYYAVWQHNQSPHIAVKFGVATDVTSTLKQYPSDGAFYLETVNHTGNHALVIVNSSVAAVHKALINRVNKSVHLFGIRETLNSDNLAVLWVNGQTVQKESDALAFFQGSFFSMFQHLPAKKQTCITTALGGDKVTMLMDSQNASLTADQQSKLTDCIAKN